MSTNRDPYQTFQYVVSLGGTIVGGFTEVTGLSPGASLSVTLKRGIAGSPVLMDWLKASRAGKIDPRQVTITLRDEASRPVRTWTLRNALPRKWVSPTFNAAGAEVVMEEIQLGTEGISLL